jgi:hypothetical protein
MTQIEDRVVSEEEATLLMLHHLAIAASLFENTHADHGKRANDMIRERFYPGSDHVGDAASAFINVLVVRYDAMAEDFDDEW